MAKETIKKELGLLIGMVDGWDGGAIPEIEKDAVLEKLRALYETVKFGVGERTSCAGESVQTEEKSEPAVPAGNIAGEERSAEEPAPAAGNEPEAMAAGQPEAATERQKDILEEEPVKSKMDRSAIMSLYGYEPAGRPADNERRPSDMFADQYKAPGRSRNEWEYTPVGAAAEQIEDATDGGGGKVGGIRGSIGIAEELLIVRELFAGDNAAYEAAVGKLDAFGDLDEAMIHIHDNYSWNPNSRGVKIIIDILTEKLS